MTRATGRCLRNLLDHWPVQSAGCGVDLLLVLSQRPRSGHRAARAGRRTGRQFLAFIKKAVKSHAGKEIHVVLDNLSTHDTPEVNAWLARNPNITFHFTPVG